MNHTTNYQGWTLPGHQPASEVPAVAAHLGPRARKHFFEATAYLMQGETVSGVWEGAAWGDDNGKDHSALGVLVVTDRRLIACGAGLGVRVNRQMLLVDVTGADFRRDALRLTELSGAMVVTGRGGYELKFAPSAGSHVAQQLAGWILALRHHVESTRR
ncbi:hypothetical protein [Streptomyces sp. NBC_01304]|uniref:hypothetical protein n=1 Tax=Streptomyces sp. NBC_01304 TaxID=2903818 RepID=UPI002E114207|nr:hypothetical protein OG430_44645 [Streptomyces sp. NBC_01304]